MKASEVYRKAAEMVAATSADLPSCWAINRVLGLSNSDYSLARSKYTALMLGGTSDVVILFPEFAHHASFSKAWINSTKPVRILALLLMSEIAKDEERK